MGTDLLIAFITRQGGLTNTNLPTPAMTCYNWRYGETEELSGQALQRCHLIQHDTYTHVLAFAYDRFQSMLCVSHLNMHDAFNMLSILKKFFVDLQILLLILALDGERLILVLLVNFPCTLR
eukprot:TRINITY_DN2102_c0_g1_i1.p1 TRINITY_DN2102_c0_g1~~TRINITY_DN2102_c0_g1_i1.p1  ORF type:complete len:122 (+),score=3.59 TRINITY_DN2102_c0_g1_i1:277-642(+)